MRAMVAFFRCGQTSTRTSVQTSYFILRIKISNRMAFLFFFFFLPGSGTRWKLRKTILTDETFAVILTSITGADLLALCVSDACVISPPDKIFRSSREKNHKWHDVIDHYSLLYVVRYSHINDFSVFSVFQKYVSEGSTVRDCVSQCVEKGECQVFLSIAE